jgi:hypothetical protein
VGLLETFLLLLVALFALIPLAVFFALIEGDKRRVALIASR